MAWTVPLRNVLRDATPGPFSKTAPLSAAGKAIERGVTRRADKVWAPGWVLPMTWLRGVMQPLSQRGNRDKIAEAVRLAEADAATERPTSSRS